ncbi:hypothetical protein Q5P01_010020 [Channa striata]|uniref:Purkinje cell protein 4 n=1 Tax=Channa striata TaxID=64152 RepID=A0AA88N287_CHASR|nr:hypothetical protein Q5P01_010020 [Channa striata]
MIQNDALTADITLPLGDDRDAESAARGNSTKIMNMSGVDTAEDASKTDVPEDFDIDMDDPETAKAAVTIQSQFRRFQKKKRDEKS